MKYDKEVKITEKGKDLAVKYVVAEIVTLLNEAVTESEYISSVDGKPFKISFIPVDVIGKIKDINKKYLKLK